MKISTSKLFFNWYQANSFLCLVFSMILLFTPDTKSNAQKESLHFEHIGIEEGLLNENITVIFQDSKGFMWFGTFDGLYKYDAYSFTKYQFDPSDSNSLSQNFIYTIFEDKDSTIWVSTFEGLCKFDRSTEKFTRYKPLPDAKFFNPNISAISEDIYGMLWVGSTSGELCRFDRKTGKFLEDSFDFDYCINIIYRDGAGTLWVGSANGLHEIKLTPAKGSQPSDVQIKKHVNDPADSNSSVSNTVTSVMEDRTGILWIGTNNGLNSFNKKTGTWKRYQNVSGDIHTLSSNNLALWSFGNGIKEDHDGNLWISTAKGLNRLNRDRTLFTSYFHNPNDNYSLSSDYIVCLQIDRAGILWAATKAGPSSGASWGSKLNKTNLNRKAFGLSRNNPTDINSLSNNQVTAIVADSAGIIWIGTHAGGLNRWDKRTNQFTHFRSDPANPKGLKHDAITAMLEDRHGHLWICNGDVLSQLNKQTSELTHYTGDHRVIYSITEDQQGLLWLGTANGIRSFDEKTREFGNYYRYDPKNPNGISDGAAQTIFADSKGNIWIGYGSMGTDKYDKKTKRFSHYKHNPRDSFSISSNIVFSFYEDSKGNLWLGSWAGGLSYFDYKKESFKTFTDKDGLAGTTVFSIVGDNSGYLWLGTRNGLSRFDPATKTFTNYDYKDGLQGNIFAAGYRERGAHFKGRDGTLYFGGSNGFNFFNPDELKISSHIAPIAITQFKLFDSLVKGANESKEIVLNYNQNYFSFEFSSLSYYNPSKNHYAYKLEGVDKDWVYSGSRHYVSYTNIDPGMYTFKVKGTNNDGVWNEKGVSISIVINPPWWRTWLAYALYAIAFLFLSIAYMKWRERSLRKEKALLEEKVDMRTRELKEEKEKVETALEQIKALQAELVETEKINERLRISRELHDDIGSTLGSISIYSEVGKKYSKKKGNTDEVLAKIGLASRELIDRMSDIVWSLNPNNDSFEQLQNRMMTFATMILAPRNILYNFSAVEELKKFQFTNEQRKNIFLIFKEAVHNIVKHSDCKAVHIQLCLKNNDFMMIVEDDGKGFAVGQVDEKQVYGEGGRLGGNGIKNMQTRASDINATMCIQSQPGEGTAIRLILHV